MTRSNGSLVRLVRFVLCRERSIPIGLHHNRNARLVCFKSFFPRTFWPTAAANFNYLKIGHIPCRLFGDFFSRLFKRTLNTFKLMCSKNTVLAWQSQVETEVRLISDFGLFCATSSVTLFSLLVRLFQALRTGHRLAIVLPIVLVL